MKVKEVMTKDPACCTAESTLAEITKLMADNDCGMIPVGESKETGKPVGTVTDRDIALKAFRDPSKDPRQMTAKDVMSKDVVTVRMDDDFDKACELMQTNQIRRIVVVDESGRCIGIVAQSDVALNAPPKETGETVEKISQPESSAAGV